MYKTFSPLLSLLLLLFVLCVLFMIFVVPGMPAHVTAASSERLRARNLFATTQNPSSFNKFLDSV